MPTPVAALEFRKDGVSCYNYGIHVLQQPILATSSERVSYVSIPGRSGSLTLLEDDNDWIADDISMSAMCVVDDNNDDRFNTIAKWLTGSTSKWEFASYPDGYFVGRASGQFSMSKVVRGNEHMTFSLSLQCRPFFYFNSGDTAVEINTGSTHRFNNPGNIGSAPLIKVYGTGACTLMCGNSTMLINDATSSSGFITIDCEGELAYTGDPDDQANYPLSPASGRLSGDWLRIPSGQSDFVFSGENITKVAVTPRWRNR